MITQFTMTLHILRKRKIEYESVKDDVTFTSNDDNVLGNGPMTTIVGNKNFYSPVFWRIFIKVRR